MKKYLALFLALIMALSLVACGGAKEEPAKEEEVKTEESATEAETEEPAKDIRIGLIPYYLRDDFYKDLVVAAQVRADELGVELVLQDPNGDAGKATELLENFVTMGLDAVALCPMSRDAMLPLFEQMQAKGCPIVTFDGLLDNVPEGIPSVALQFDFYDCGLQMGKMIEEYVTKTGHWDGETKLRTAVIWMPTSATVGVPIIEEAEKYLIEKGIIEVVAKQDSKADRNHSMGVMENILQAEQGNIQLILGFNYDGCMGAVKACESYGMTDEDCMAFSQLWGVEAFQQMEDGNSIWKGGVAYSPADFGSNAVQACYDILNGVEREQICFLTPTVLNPDNIDSFDWESIIENRKLVE